MKAKAVFYINYDNRNTHGMEESFFGGTASECLDFWLTGDYPVPQNFVYCEMEVETERGFCVVREFDKPSSLESFISSDWFIVLNQSGAPIGAGSASSIISDWPDGGSVLDQDGKEYNFEQFIELVEPENKEVRELFDYIIQSYREWTSNNCTDNIIDFFVLNANFFNELHKSSTHMFLYNVVKELGMEHAKVQRA